MSSTERSARADDVVTAGNPVTRIALVVSPSHERHHVRDRGYVETPMRIEAIASALATTDLFESVPTKPYPDRHITDVHDVNFVAYIREACRTAGKGKPIYPYVLPVRNTARMPHDLSLQAGYYCIDTFTPLDENAWQAARAGVDCTMTAADLVLAGRPLAYALVRPPGHHAERRTFGGFCYFCNAAIAAHHLSGSGRVAILDIDYHHGNGQQDIFWERADVLTVSIHGDPRIAYPYFCGFQDEIGAGAGKGYNLNLPLPERIVPDDYRDALTKALGRIRAHEPAFLVVAAGFDTAKGDPTGTWPHQAEDFAEIGRMIGAEAYPTLIVQEGGYRLRTLGINACSFFAGLHAGYAQAGSRPPQAPAPLGVAPARSPAPLAFRREITHADIARVRALVAATKFFSEAEVAIAAELVEERLLCGDASGYHFVLAEDARGLAGYACFGPIAGTEGSFDLFWIAVDPARQGSGIGRAVLAAAEDAMRAMGARRHYAETSSTPLYESTRAFYRRTGFREVACIPDFYRPGDGKVIYERVL